uniref:DUS-like FMN-binding domain-containing protein n=1 Tax=Chromera velia CCMP2878 TaxID=1169474 RepID=A0A0G4I934_9ALVE|eukprot:Cvel_12134.t1-p1 / transcript=Cvel_12134.t1 / gene=Cvel_12134 / organism=Chromera_velia_CCMP2878 / gene_product=tRNA-dihydrouridine(16/17) synthase [NAD(P)( )], putative / transcript_product=tRNA-dihydrouridine(16/17) synthase [NAD(P)( )], putative / location=Cvel_scaffold782:8265-9863(-) / protein_length=533 / sequence_SO=supercontig / SO=protein_coding / is_pseudo=false
MVDQSHLPFRVFVNRYGADFSYTPMVNAKVFADTKKYRREVLSDFLADDHPLSIHDRPVIAQVGGTNPAQVVDVAHSLESSVSGIDLNLGCRQKMASKGRFGAFLLRDDSDQAVNIVRSLREALHPDKTVSVKIRMVDNHHGPGATVRIVKRLVEAGAEWVAVHARTIEQHKTDTGCADWEFVRRLREEIGSVPVVVNGGVEFQEDLVRSQRASCADGVMVAEGILENPLLFWEGKTSDGRLWADDLSLSDEEIAARQLWVAFRLIDYFWDFAPDGREPQKPGKRTEGHIALQALKEHLAKVLHRLMQREGVTGLRDTLMSGVTRDYEAVRAVVEVLADTVTGCVPECADGLGSLRGLRGPSDPGPHRHAKSVPFLVRALSSTQMKRLRLGKPVLDRLKWTGGMVLPESVAENRITAVANHSDCDGRGEQVGEAKEEVVQEQAGVRHRSEQKDAKEGKMIRLHWRSWYRRHREPHESQRWEESTATEEDAGKVGQVGESEWSSGVLKKYDPLSEADLATLSESRKTRLNVSLC